MTARPLHQVRRCDLPGPTGTGRVLPADPCASTYKRHTATGVEADHQFGAGPAEKLWWTYLGVVSAAEHATFVALDDGGGCLTSTSSSGTGATRP